MFFQKKTALRQRQALALWSRFEWLENMNNVKWECRGNCRKTSSKIDVAVRCTFKMYLLKYKKFNSIFDKLLLKVQNDSNKVGQSITNEDPSFCQLSDNRTRALNHKKRRATQHNRRIKIVYLSSIRYTLLKRSYYDFNS